MTNATVSLIVPVYNEEASIFPFLRSLRQTIDVEPYSFEIIFINDGSSDNTFHQLLAARKDDPRVKIIDLSRNFGKEVALAAGFRHADGAAVIPMDVDLQDPPELIPAFLRKWEEGYQTVIGVRRQRQSDTCFKRHSASFFYQCFNKLSGINLVANGGDYRLLSRTVLDALNDLPERVRFTKGLYAWVGFPRALVPYDRPPRAAGKTSWNVWKLWNFALDGITSFSTLPLRVWSYVGFCIAMMGFLYAAWLIVRTLVFGADLPGYPSLMVVLLTLGGLILTSLGIIGEYLGRVFEETKSRPLYLTKNMIGFSPRAGGPDNRCPHCGQKMPR